LQDFMLAVDRLKGACCQGLNSTISRYQKVSWFVNRVLRRPSATSLNCTLPWKRLITHARED